MPTILSHPAVALPFASRMPRRVVFLGVIGSIIPDADVAAFAFGIPYAHTFGHRGFTHSIAFAALFALLATFLVRGRIGTFAFLFLCTVSHAILDAFTDGGLGVAFFSPFSNERYFFPSRDTQTTRAEVSPGSTGAEARAQDSRPTPPR